MKISVVTVVRNCRTTILDCLQSVAEQRFRDHEHVVVDGASTDGTQALIEQRGHQVDKFISEHDDGIYSALNKGVRLATGEVIGFLNADDLYADDDVLGRVAQAFDESDIDAIYGDLLYVSKQNTEKIIRYWRAGNFWHARLARGWMPPHPTMYVRREIYEQLGGFDESYRIAGDYDYVLRMFKDPQLRVVYVPHVLVKMRIGGTSNATIANLVRKSTEDYRALRKNRVGGMATLFCKNLRKLNQFEARPSSSETGIAEQGVPEHRTCADRNSDFRNGHSSQASNT